MGAKLLGGILIAALLALQYRLWVGEQSLAAVRHLEATVDAQRQENQTLEGRNRRLEAEVDDLKQGLEAVEERARRELGMIHEDETFYQFLE